MALDMESKKQKRHEDESAEPKRKKNKKSDEIEEETPSRSERKKKKKRVEEQGQVEGGDGESKGPKAPSKRQLKRERHAERVAEADRASREAVKTQALSYLSLWKHNRAEWKFNKAKQIWLLRHKFDAAVPDELWEPLVEYIGSGAPGIKRLALDDCQKAIGDAEEKGAEAAPLAYKRARALMQSVQ